MRKQSFFTILLLIFVLSTTQVLAESESDITANCANNLDSVEQEPLNNISNSEITMQADDLTLEAYEIDMNYDNPNLYYAGYVSGSYLYGYYTSVQILSGDVTEIESSDTDIVVAEKSSFKRINLYSTKKVGSAKVTVKGLNGETKEIIVNVSFPFELSKTHIDVNCSYRSYYHLDYFSDGYSRVASYYVGAEGSLGYAGLQVEAITSKNSIVKVRSLTPKVVTVNENMMNSIDPVGVGTGVIECTDIYGQTAQFTVSVSKGFVNDYIKHNTYNISGTSRSRIFLQTVPNALVSVVVSGKRSSSTADKNGYAMVPIAPCVGDVHVTYTITVNGGAYSGSADVFMGDGGDIEAYAYRNSKKIKVNVCDTQVGDTLIVKIGKKTYKKKIKANSDDYSCSFKSKTKLKAGKKYTVSLVDSSGRVVAKQKAVVYIAKKVKKGMTKKQCKLVPGWGSPDDVYYRSGKLLWWYDDGSYLLFKRGRLIGWHY